MRFVRATLAAVLTTCVHIQSVAAQTYTTCNPLESTDCSPDSALGKSISVDFRNGEVDSFTSSGTPTYDSNGVSFTVAESGDAPQLTSKFYIMFGKVEITMKAAPGAGIVSTLVLESDDLDEIDMEWLGADSTEVQTNYFGKGDVTTYNRGTYAPNAGNQDEFITYTVEWTSEQIVWTVAGDVVRVLTPDTADTNQYPQTPMVVKFGCWSGGDSSNAAGTISWARGPTDYSDGPFTMVVQSVSIADYSTGTEYEYTDTSGDWTAISAVGGSVNGNLPSSATVAATADASAATSASPSIPAAFGGHSKDDTSTMTGWPWVATATATASATPTTTYDGVPSGWTVSSDGKLVPASSAATSYPSSTTSLFLSSSSYSSVASAVGLETITTYNEQGFPTTVVVPVGYETESKSYDDQGFLITSTPAVTAAASTPTSQAGGGISSVNSGNNVVGAAAAQASTKNVAAGWQGRGLWETWLGRFFSGIIALRYLL